MLWIGSPSLHFSILLTGEAGRLKTTFLSSKYEFDFTDLIHLYDF